MQNEWKATAPDARNHTEQATMVIAMAVREHDRAQVGDSHAEHIQVVQRSSSRPTGIVEEGLAPSVVLHGDQQRVAMLGQEMVGRGIERGPRTARHLGARQERVPGVIDQDQHLERVDGLEVDGPHAIHGADRRAAMSIILGCWS